VCVCMCVCVCVSVCLSIGPHDNLKTRSLLQMSALCLVVTQTGEKSRTSWQGQGHFSESSRSLGNVTSYSVAADKIPSLIASWSSFASMSL